MVERDLCCQPFGVFYAFAHDLTVITVFSWVQLLTHFSHYSVVFTSQALVGGMFPNVSDLVLRETGHVSVLSAL